MYLVKETQANRTLLKGLCLSKSTVIFLFPLAENMLEAEDYSRVCDCDSTFVFGFPSGLLK